MAAPPPPTAPPPPRPDEAGTDPSEGPGPRRLTRHRRGRLVGGVAAGLGRYLGVDRVVVRIAFVVLAFVPFPGFGVLLYIAMLLLVPEQDADGAVVPTRLTERTPAFWIGVGLVGLATFALLGVVGDGRTSGLVPLLLIGLGVALWVDADRRPGPSADPGRRPAPPSPPSPGTDPAAAWQPPAASTAPVWEVAAPGPTADAPDATAAGDAAAWSRAAQPTEPVPSAAPPAEPPASTAPAWTPPPVPRRSRSPLGRVTLGLALLAGGAAWTVDLLDVAHVPVSSMLATALVVLGLGLLVGCLYGRARWLVAIVAFVLPATLGAVAIEDLGIDLRGGFDERVVVVTEAGQLDAPVTVAAGSLTVDLRELPATADVVLDASVGAGELIVLVPEGSGLRGEARVAVGELRLLNDISTGLTVRRTVAAAAEPGRPTFDLDLRVGAGELRVRTVPARDADTGDDPSAAGEGAVTDDPMTDDPMTDDATTEVQP